MDWQPARFQAEVLAEGEALLAVLMARKLTPSGEARKRILACRDLATLDRWITRAVKAKTLAEVFGEGA
ncbi:MAG: hypothetical protein ACYCWW_14690 [Deltaproteobacteria bacterium]